MIKYPMYFDYQIANHKIIVVVGISCKKKFFIPHKNERKNSFLKITHFQKRRKKNRKMKYFVSEIFKIFQ